MRSAFVRSSIILCFASLLGCSDYQAPPNGGVQGTGSGSAGSGSGSLSGGQAAGSATLSQQEINDLMAVHNNARAEVGVPPMSYSNGLAAFAQAWADHLASIGCKLQHRPDSGPWAQRYGENIAMMSGSGASAGRGAQMWYDEKSAYRGGPVTMSNLMSVGHYTQMVWRNSTQVGCGKAVCANGTVIIVCNYSPGGNFLNEAPY